MAHKPFGVGDGHAAQNQFPPAAKAVSVKAMADAKFLSHWSQTVVEPHGHARGTFQVAGGTES